ncbi:MAG: hypothetical protein FD122_1146 [Stygiobacter sp.]|nr:MAG: hypothetical protein FD122_1146 [Stygiobacter sp.]KAF0215115.1 MAG: hypothetical protein FD178_1941 [Ignavibacteria bacterium]
MKTHFSFVVLFLSSCLFAQSAKFNLNDYKTFLANHKNLTYSEMANMYNTGTFRGKVPFFPTEAKYLDSIKIKYEMTADETGLLNKNGFVVTERNSSYNMRNMLADIWQKDLPVFISTDLIHNAFHQSYDAILKQLEIDFIIPKLGELLLNLHSKLNELDKKYSANAGMKNSLQDVDLYLSVALKLLDKTYQPYYETTIEEVNQIQTYVNSLGFVEVPLFSESRRKMDYSQFKVRGHYTDQQFPQLAKYFQSMIWLGRTELYLIAPQSADSVATKEDVQRQIIDSYLISELLTLSGSQELLDGIEKAIQAFVGEQDNVTVEQLRSVFTAANIVKCENLLGEENVKRFQDTLVTKPFSEQRILSQLLESDPMSPEQIKPASAFLLFGQRFVIDSYVTGNVVFDRIPNKITRMLPSTLDILFSLGNSASVQLLQPEIEKYKYASNLAALRYLIDSYGNEFWDNSIYNLWLNSIRSLNPPVERNNLPAYMQTAAWWQQKINSQLSSWTELRHDNILYAKQSYTGMAGCSYPYGYVEPVPVFYQSMKNLALKTIDKLSQLSVDMKVQKEYFKQFSSLMDTLGTIAQKELSNQVLSEAEKKFLRSVLSVEPAGCGGSYNGWYQTRLLYSHPSVFGNLGKKIVADYHTAPTDEFGNIVGWVKHAGTGFPNLCVVVANLPSVGDVAFAGPVSSYYEYTTTNFTRINDDEWLKGYLVKAQRPDWVNSYLATSTGSKRNIGAELLTDIEEVHNQEKLPNSYEILVSNYPNPFNPETNIVFTVPFKLSNQFTELNIYDISGKQIKKLIAKELPAGNYITQWDGTNQQSQKVSSGIYLFRVSIGNHSAAGKMNMLK